ncbi:MAG: hypothetical protein OZ930_12945, partial [Ignavibacteria bacterium]|nr:hypothetical protein [Ignavibacteria bacterium]
MKLRYRIIYLSILLCAFTINPGDEEKYFPKILDDDNSKYTNIGNIGITVTNFGTYGHGFVLWPEQPSCQYPIGSGIEHLFDGGLYVGGFIRGVGGPFVTTGAVDIAQLARTAGFEYTNAVGSRIKERSSLFDSRYFNPNAISHQDFLMDYTDTNVVYLNGDPIINHDPLGISVHQETYAWNFPFANFFVIFNYWIKNVNDKNIDSVYVGLWTDAVVRNTNITGNPRNGGTAFYNKGGNGYNDSIKIAYEFDAAGDLGFSDSYIGVLHCGSEPKLPDKYPISLVDSIPSVNFVTWQFNAPETEFFAPQNDFDRYGKMRGYFSGTSRWKDGITPQQIKTPSNRSILITNGHFPTIAPGDSINVVFAIVCAKKYGPDPANLDTEEQKTNLYINADWALRAYFGEDKNRNGILDPGEDLDSNGKITRYILPAPPAVPVVKVIPKDREVEIYWDKRAELSIDPISGKQDFEGYKIYRTQAGFDLTQGGQDIFNSLVTLAQFDSAGNGVSFDTGFEFVELPEPVTFPGDTVQYYYKYKLTNLLNGWQYLFAVSAFDEGDPENNLDILESSPLANFQRVLPGTPSTDDPDIQIGVYPNPYYGNAIWDGSSERLRKIYFFNLPSDCQITIYTLSGDVVKRIDHTSSSNSSEVRWFETYAPDGKQKFAGGEHAWDLLTDNEQAIATGMYLFTVKNNNSGDIKTGKFLV